MSLDANEADVIAARILAASDTRAPIPPITDENPSFDLADAYRVSAAVTRRRIARGETQVGWKIGFTNSSIWAAQGLNAPIWGPMYEGTVGAVAKEGASVDIGRLAVPRIEPEIGLRLRSVPRSDMDEAELLACVDAVTHGFEIVQSIYPGWRLKAADAIAAFGMHGLYRHGPLVPVPEADRPRWLKMLAEFTVAIFRDGAEVERGAGRNVLGGPLSALRHFVGNLPKYPGYELRPGDLITTGTLTSALPIAAGERWSTKLDGIPLTGMDLAIA